VGISLKHYSGAYVNASVGILETTWGLRVLHGGVGYQSHTPCRIADFDSD
jgi:hypothetical protein